MHMKTVELLPIDRLGDVPLPVDSLSDLMQENCKATASFYQGVGFELPWIGYVSVAEGRPVGGGAFKGPPRVNCVEIAYYTLPEFEGQGFASATARALVRIARRAMPAIIVTAQTLPTLNASNTLLKRLGFTFRGEVLHPEDGVLWEWQLHAHQVCES
jgi:[ribosomal protein S5]-alanine N-acetyltransferase